MSFEILVLKGSISDDFVFEFEEPVLNYTVGISYFDMYYTSSNHDIYQIGVDLTSTATGNTVTVAAHAVMNDAHNQLAPGSFLVLTCVAEVGNAAGGLATLANIPSTVSTQTQIGTAGVPGAALSGFNMSMGSAAELKVLAVSAGANEIGNNLYSPARASNIQHSSTIHDDGTVDMGMISVAENQTAAGLFMVNSAAIQDGKEEHVTEDGTVVPIYLDGNVLTANLAAMMTSFHLECGSAHKIQFLRIGCESGWVGEYDETNDRTKVTLSTTVAVSSKTGDYNQDSSKSTASYCVVGVASS